MVLLEYAYLEDFLKPYSIRGYVVESRAASP